MSSFLLIHDSFFSVAVFCSKFFEELRKSFIFLISQVPFVNERVRVITMLQIACAC